MRLILVSTLILALALSVGSCTENTGQGTGPAATDCPSCPSKPAADQGGSCSSCPSHKPTTAKPEAGDSCCGTCKGDKQAKPACAKCGKGLPGEIFWCDSCNKGFINGKETACKGCIQAAQDGTACAACAARNK